MRRTGVLMVPLLIAGMAIGAWVKGRQRPDGPNDVTLPAAVDLLVWAGKQPARLELRVEVDGRPVAAAWDDTFSQLFAYFDRDRSGHLNREEAARLPGAFDLRQILWGQLPFDLTRPPAWQNLDADHDGLTSPAEMAGYYRRAGLGNALVGAGRPVATDPLTAALLKALDHDGNGLVSEVECKSSPTSLAKLDGNDDELVGPGELVPGVAYPGAMGTNLVSPPRPGTSQGAAVEGLPLLLLPADRGDRHWVAVAQARRAASKLPAVSDKALMRLRDERPAAVWTVRLGRRSVGAGVLENLGEPVQPGPVVFHRGGVRISLRSEDGELPGRFSVARKSVESLFSECDRNDDGVLDTDELKARSAGGLRRISRVTDRDGDRKLTWAELNAWLDLLGQVAKGHVLVTLLDHGQGLFEVLDEDQDGSLSVPEMRSTWDRLTVAGCVTPRGLDLGLLPRQVRAAVSRGQPMNTLGAPVRAGPAWFRAMDRNGDGVVSRREFVGPLEAFDKIDVDRDGVCTPAEAVRMRMLRHGR